MKLPTLYKMKKKLLQWEIETIHSPEYSEYKITHGQQGGKLQTTSTMVTQGKNIGKANETSIQEQCDAEAKALWQKQIDRKGYATEYLSQDEMLTDLVKGGLPSPMLALEYDKFAHKVVYPCHVSAKLDGSRALAFLRGDKVVILSRQRKEFNHLDHLRAELLPILQAHPNLILDGELYSHQYTFQEIISAIKRDEPNELTQNVEYHTYDLINRDGFGERFKLLSGLVQGLNHIKLVDAPLIQSADEIEDYHKQWTSQGYEGVMIRNTDGVYKQDGRSQDLLKYKKFITEEFKIVGAKQNKGKLANTCVFTLECNGTTFDSMPEGSQEQREQYWTDWQNGTIKEGDMGTVRFFSWSTSSPSVPRFPIFLCVRSYE